MKSKCCERRGDRVEGETTSRIPELERKGQHMRDHEGRYIGGGVAAGTAKRAEQTRTKAERGNEERGCSANDRGG